jgi:RNA polymerase sigma factor (sigma-70 family)
LLQIVLNVDRDRRRRLRDQTPLRADQLRANGVQPIDQAMANEQQTQIRTAIDSLPDRQREVALLCLGEGLAAHEVAEVLQITTANVHTCLHLARKRIAQAIGWHIAQQKEQ